MKYNYTKDELSQMGLILSAKDRLLDELQVYRKLLEFANLQLRNVERCETGLMAEMLFERGVPLDKLDNTDFGAEYLEVYDDQS